MVVVAVKVLWMPRVMTIAAVTVNVHGILCLNRCLMMENQMVIRLEVTAIKSVHH